MIFPIHLITSQRFLVHPTMSEITPVHDIVYIGARFNFTADTSVHWKIDLPRLSWWSTRPFLVLLVPFVGRCLLGNVTSLQGKITAMSNPTHYNPTSCWDSINVLNRSLHICISPLVPPGQGTTENRTVGLHDHPDCTDLAMQSVVPSTSSSITTQRCTTSSGQTFSLKRLFISCKPRSNKDITKATVAGWLKSTIAASFRQAQDTPPVLWSCSAYEIRAFAMSQASCVQLPRLLVGIYSLGPMIVAAQTIINP